MLHRALRPARVKEVGASFTQRRAGRVITLSNGESIARNHAQDGGLAQRAGTARLPTL